MTKTHHTHAPLIIEATGVTRVFEVGGVETHALRGVDVSISHAEFVAVIGKSGAGKSTLMYQLSLLDVPTEGEIVINGVNAKELSGHERTHFRLNNLGYVFQDYALVPELTAEENVMLPLLMRGESHTAALSQAREVLDRLRLSHRLDHRPGRLSGGEQQRVSIARAIAHEPLILFADEPTANLDSETSRELLTYLEELHDHAGQTIVMVTHELDYAARAERVIEIQDGRVVREGTPKSLKLATNTCIK